MDSSNIRNFCIIAHIDHGKSTLADRLMEMTGAVEKREMQEQILDSNPIERERGITIKLAPVRMIYTYKPSTVQGISAPLSILNSEFVLNLIDTPGHVDFSYEVSRSLAACEGAVLLVDATQGVQAQTIAHLARAREQKLTIIPVINKIDLPGARVEDTARQLESLGFSSPICISAKTGEGVAELLSAIISHVPPPRGEPKKPLRALVFSSQYDPHKGVVVFVRVVDGHLSLARHSLLRLGFLASGAEIAPVEIGYFSPKMTPCDTLRNGEVGYIATGFKDARLAKVGDTLTLDTLTPDKITPLPGYRDPKPMVYLGLFPISSDDLTAARQAMERLKLSDAAFTFKPIHSTALGNGFHCGFLGLLHAEIVQERLFREFGLSMLATAPTVEYKENLEPVMKVMIFTPREYVGAVMQLVAEKRGDLVDHIYLGDQAQITYLVPLAELIVDFFDRLKSISEGYASLDYEFFDYKSVKLVKLDILVNKEPVDALSLLVVEDQAHRRGREIVERLAAAIPRQQFEVPIQAAIGGKIIARADVKAFRKDVTGKLYGGDRTRKDKLLEAQKKGKSRMKMVGRVAIPQSAFLSVLKS